jgi:DNA-binding PadR family transcriptional regulator
MKHTRLSPEFVLMGFLNQNPGHGYDLHKRLTDEFGYIWHVSQSQTYNILTRLEIQGYIGSTTIEQEKLPNRRLFHLTDTGIQHFNDWLNSPTQCSVHAIRVEFITRLYFLQQNQPHRLQEVFRTQINEVEKGLQRLEETRLFLAEDQAFNHLALDLRIRLLRSIITWLEECRKKFSPNPFSKDKYE